MMNSRKQVLHTLVTFEKPLELIAKELSLFEWDYEGEPVIIEPIHVVSVLNRFLSGDFNAKQVEDWANMIECREDLDYNESNQEQMEQVIYELANPELEGRLTIERCNGIFFVLSLPHKSNQDYTKKLGLVLEEILSHYRMSGVLVNPS